MRLERVLFPEHDVSSWGKMKSKNSSLRGKAKVRRGKRSQQKYKVGKKEDAVSILMRLNENKPTKRTKKIIKSSKQRPVPHADSQIHIVGSPQSSLALNDSKSSINFVSEPMLHSLGATDSLIFLGSINGNGISKVKQSMSGRKSAKRRNKRQRVSNRETDIVEKEAQGTDSHFIVRDSRFIASQRDKSETTQEATTQNRLKETENSGKSSQQNQQQEKSRRPKRQRDHDNNTSKMHDIKGLHETKSGGGALKTAAEKPSKRKRDRVVKFVSEQNERRRGQRSKGKLLVTSGGLNGLCGLENHGFSFPVPDPVLNRSVLVSPLSVESINSNANKSRGKRSKNTKKSIKKTKDGAKSETKENSVRGRKNTRETRKVKALSKKEDGNNTFNQSTSKKSLQPFESEPESVCASFSPESPESLCKQDGSRQMPPVSSAEDENMPINRCALKTSHEVTKKKSHAKSFLSTESRVANSRLLVSLSQSWYLDSSSQTSLTREALNEGAGAYVLDVEEADMTLLKKNPSSALEQNHGVVDFSKAKNDDNENAETKPVSTKKKAPPDSFDDKENIGKKPIRKNKSTLEEEGNAEKETRQVRRFGRSIECNVKPSEQSTQAQVPCSLAEKEKAVAEPTPLRRSTRIRRSSSSSDGKGNSEEKGTGLRRSRRSVGRPRRLGEYEGDDDSTYAPTPLLTRSTSKKALSAKTSAKKKILQPTKFEEEQHVAEEAKIDSNQWNEYEVLLLREAQKVVDPKSYSYWQDVAGLMGGKSAEECQEKWFSLAKTPNQRKKKGKEASKQIANSPQDDDIFDATPMKALFAGSSGGKDPLMGSMGFLSQLNLGSAVKVDRVPVEHDSTSLATTRGYKSYIRDMKREVHAKSKNKKPRLPKEGNSKVKNLRERAEEGDIELRGRLSPGGTLHMTSNVDEDIDDGYDIDEEYDDVDPFFPRIQS